MVTDVLFWIENLLTKKYDKYKNFITYFKSFVNMRGMLAMFTICKIKELKYFGKIYENL